MWQLRESAHPVLTDEGGAILDERTCRWTHLTPTASAAVMLLLAGTTEEEAAGQYAERYGISHKHAAADVHTVATRLTTLGLATATPADRRRWRRWKR
ncbi:PqqD family protein [Streptomyces lydicus]|uniref:PqqD family protein n=1 Tax=Streptomyces lydicus TaxID=47763 RepID=UPI0036E9AFE3